MLLAFKGFHLIIFLAFELFLHENNVNENGFTKLVELDYLCKRSCANYSTFSTFL